MKSDSILGTFYHNSLRVKIFKALKLRYLKIFRSQIENKGSLKVEEAILDVLVQNIKRQ